MTDGGEEMILNSGLSMKLPIIARSLIMTSA
jgi:hypothetical protein